MTCVRVYRRTLDIKQTEVVLQNAKHELLQQGTRAEDRRGAGNERQNERVRSIGKQDWEGISERNAPHFRGAGVPMAGNRPATGRRAGQAIEGGPECPVGVVIVAFPSVEPGGRVLGRSMERERGTRGGHDRC